MTSARSDLKACESGGALEARGGTLKVKDILKWNGAGETICEKNGVAVTPSATEVVFNLESWGQLSCKEILDQSADILLAKAEELEKSL